MIRLNADQTVSEGFKLDSGDHVFAVSAETAIPSAVTQVTLDVRFVIRTDPNSNEVTWSAWQAAGTLPQSDCWADVFQASPQLEYRVRSNASGVVVHISKIAYQIVKN